MTVAELIAELQALEDHNIDVFGASGHPIDGISEEDDDGGEYIQLTEDQD